ncbi:hypothetical protein [Paenibacillus amylolyticus]
MKILRRNGESGSLIEPGEGGSIVDQQEYGRYCLAMGGKEK